MGGGKLGAGTRAPILERCEGGGLESGPVVVLARAEVGSALWALKNDAGAGLVGGLGEGGVEQGFVGDHASGLDAAGGA